MLTDKILNEIRRILFLHITKENNTAFIFGSWSNGTARKFSDIDLGIESAQGVTLGTLGKIREDFENSSLPYSVDIVDFTTVSEKFKNVAKKSLIALN